MMEIQDPLAAGMHQFSKYWRFLLPYTEDARQEIQVAILECGEGASRQLLNAAINRKLYALAVSTGFRKRHMHDVWRNGGSYWVRRTVLFSELSIGVLVRLEEK